MDLWDFYNIPVAQYVNKSIVKVSDKDSVQKAVELMAQKNIGCLIVDYEGGKVGIVSERDIVREYAMELYDFFEASVSDIMTVCPVMIDISDKLGRAFELMHKHHIRHLPVSENGRTVFKFSPADFATHVAGFVNDFGVNIVGGCCGTRPAHIEAVAKAIQGVTPKVREIDKTTRLSGPQNAVYFDTQKSLIRIGERLNVRGSLKVREAVESGGAIDFDALDAVVAEQVNDLGLDVIDVCMDSNLVNTEDTLVKVVEHVTTDFKGAICLDSFSVEALTRAIEVYPGRPILNSISLEEYQKGVDKIDAVVSKTHQHHPMYIALCTDQTGPAVTATAKADMARRIYEKCRDKYGVTADQLIIDVNAFPIGSESDPNLNFSMESINAIPLIKKIHPDLRVSMGVGNLTNGLAKKPYMRKVLTSVFMDLARKAGMDTAIINPDHYVPVESLDSEDVKLARAVIEKRDMDAFATLEEIAERKKGGKVQKRSNYDDLSNDAAICQKIKDGFKQKLPGTAVLNDFKYEYQDFIVSQVAIALKTHAPLDFINKHLMGAMKDLGDGFAKGEVSLPHLLKSADVMKSCMGFIEAYMKFKSGANIHDEIQYKGTVVIGTVYQDVHSIGKDLVKTLLENYGYRVIDLGVQTALEKFIDTAKQYNAHAIGMSALLVQTSNHMITVARMVKEAGLNVDLLIGGAPVNNRHAAYVSMHGQSDSAQLMPNVFYCPSGMDGVNVMNQLRESKESRDVIVAENSEKLKWHYDQAVKQSQNEAELLEKLPRRTISFDGVKRAQEKILKPKKLESTLADFAKHLDLKTLFSLNWRFGGKAAWEKKGESEESLNKRLSHWIKRCDEHKWIVPQAVCAILACRRDGDEVIVDDVRIPFSVVIGADKKDTFSAAQYYATDFDLIGLQISTAGPDVDKQVQKFKDEGDSESALLLQGLSDRVAEDMAELAHNFLRAELGLKKGDGTRYSPGYPGLKDIHVNATIAKLLDAQGALKITLTDAGEFYPTGTTGAVVCFHPQARYD